MILTQVRSAARALVAVIVAFGLTIGPAVSVTRAADPPPPPEFMELKLHEGDVVEMIFKFAGNAPAGPFGLRANVYVQDTLILNTGSVALAPSTFNHAVKALTKPVSQFGLGSTDDIQYCIALQMFVGDGSDAKSTFSAETGRKCVGTQRVLIPTQSTGPCPFAACDTKTASDAKPELLAPSGINASGIVDAPAGGVSSVLTGTGAAPPAAVVPTLPRLAIGANDYKVRVLQLLLNEHDADIEVDGDFGPQTEGAVSDFQESKGLTADGVVNAQTWNALFVTVRRGDKGEAVQAAQEALTGRNQNVDMDGDFGPQTEAATRAFQASTGITADGVIGPQTWLRLVGTP